MGGLRMTFAVALSDRLICPIYKLALCRRDQTATPVFHLFFWGLRGVGGCCCSVPMCLLPRAWISISIDNACLESWISSRDAGWVRSVVHSCCRRSTEEEESSSSPNIRRRGQSDALSPWSPLAMHKGRKRRQVTAEKKQSAAEKMTERSNDAGHRSCRDEMAQRSEFARRPCFYVVSEKREWSRACSNAARKPAVCRSCMRVRELRLGGLAGLRRAAGSPASVGRRPDAHRTRP